MHWEDENVFEEQSEEGWKTERIDFKSIGIDIGSSTSHLMVSHLVLRRRGQDYFGGYTVVEREVIYKSPIMLTPYLNNNYTIDTEKLSEFISRSYREAGLTPEEIDTGAVITTGEAAKKENAANIINLFAQQAGKFVCATAGPNLEGTLAAHGSGAVRYTLHHHEGHHPTILNVDIGGGTTKIAVVKEGRVLETCAVNVGSRLVAWDEEGRLTRVEDAGRRVAESLGIAAEMGRRLSAGEKESLAERLAEVLFSVVSRQPLSHLAGELMITPNLTYDGPVDLLIFSGGVSEFVYEEEEGEYGDLGVTLGRRIRLEAQRRGFRVERPEQRIRATVIGASQYTVQVSGNTIFISDKGILPMRSLPVASIRAVEQPLTRQGVAREIERAFRVLDLEEGAQLVALAIRWRQEPAYDVIAEFAAGLVEGLPRTLREGLPVILVFDGDVGSLVGHRLAELLKGRSPILSVDSIDLRGLNFIDIGQELPDTKAVPVTVKSLVFK